MKNAISAQSVRDQVLSHIRADLLEGKFPVGTPLRIDTLAAELGVSHMPVREALHVLTVEGLLTRRPRRGVVVSGLEPDDVRGAYDVMAVLEGIAARYAAEHVDHEVIQKLRALNATMRGKLDREDVGGEVLALNREFHSAIYELCPNRWVMEFLRQLWNYTYRVRGRHPRSMKRVRQSVGEHDELLDALEAGDGQKAESLAAKHCLCSLDDLLELL